MADDLGTLMGLGPHSTEDQVRRRYRELALLAHPDLNQDDPGAEKRFRALVKLRDALLIRAREAARESHGGDGPPAPDHTAGNASSRRGSLRLGSQIVVPVDLDFVEAARGIDLAFRLPGGGAASVRVPPGSVNGDLLRVAIRTANGLQRTLIFELRVPPHRIYRHQGADLIVRVPWTDAQVVHGGAVEVTTPFERLTIHVDPYHPRGELVRCPGKGLPTQLGRGDLYVELADRRSALGRGRTT